MIEVAIFGYGTVGSGVYEVLTKNSAEIAARVGDDIHIKYVLDLRDFPGDPVESVLVHNVDEILEDPAVRIVVEVMGGLHPAYEFVKRALESNKSVCTSNKELVAAKGAELIALAKEHQVSFLFEASVGGGIPIIRPLLTSVTADSFLEISGILNGTTNYILTAMTNEGANFEDVLKKAQELGYAERNPEADIEGYDAERKIAILTSLAVRQQVDYEDVETEGITKITGEDIAYAGRLGYKIKLLGMSRFLDGKVYAQVAPFLIDETHPLYHVDDVFNAVYIRGNMVGDLMFYGSGAGKLPTASAVCGDVVEAARTLGTAVPIVWRPEKLTLGDNSAFMSRFFVRAENTEEEVLAAFGSAEVISREKGTVFITGTMRSGDFDKKAEALSIINRIRIA